MKAIPIVDDVFNSGGTLTLGQFTPGSGDFAMGDYKGYIDEVRVWSRPHNPTIISNNFRKMITDETSDVWHSWTFNEGFGFTAYEYKQGDSLVAVDLITPPEWAKSDLNLSEDKDLNAPRLTTEDELSAAVLLDAQTLCDNLISNFLLSIVGSSIDVLMDVYEAICVQELTSTDDETQAAAVLASMTDMYLSVGNTSTNPLTSLCNVMTSLSTYIGASGDNCTACLFGNVDNGTCVCYDSHWGTTCDSICPVGQFGACNTFGVCDDVLGVCNCHPKHYTEFNSATSFWEMYVSSSSMNMTANYTCETCSDNWYGKECQYAKENPKSTSSYFGIIYGSYVTNFEGVSYTHVTPGVYSLLTTPTIEVQALFLPCLGDNKCRYMKEIAIQKDGSVVMIQHAEIGENVTVTIDYIDVYFPYTSSSGDSVTVEWTEDLYIKLAVGGSSFIILDSEMGLIATVKVSSSIAKDNTGLLGKADNDWTKEFQCVNETVALSENEITSDVAGVCVRERYSTDLNEIFINHTDAEDFLSSGGYAMSLSNGESFSVSGFTVEQGLIKFASGFWVKSSTYSKKRSTLSYPLLTIDAGSLDIEFRVNNSYFEIVWDTRYTTTLTFDIDTWYYLAFSWVYDGSATIYLITTNGVQEYSISDMNTGGTVDVNQFSMTPTSSARVTFDCLRSWAKTTSLADAVSDMKNYCDDTTSDASMMLTMTFDEGNGTMSSMTTYSTNDGTNTGTITGTVSGTISGKYNKPITCLCRCGI